ncbi:MFS general substrate transporter [Meira miltonrushii]|uniref:MFS general substrate transporter n=1 Tax=Meira miltonrushii TaxID=1280837 RepID=A0A316VCE2_9BASI|nr:MFS general substrate transporter [Meira miltonrushii]PWN35206.1 MFS general substrate transporter [Meira miltonrushii]
MHMRVDPAARKKGVTPNEIFMSIFLLEFDDILPTALLSSPPPSCHTLIRMTRLISHWTSRAAENFKLLFQIRDEPTQSDSQKGEQGIRVGIQRPISPIVLLSKLDKDHWLALLAGFIAFYADFLDFNVLATATTKIADYYQTSKTHVSDSITYTMALRVVGAAIFGFFGDLVGRRWPLIIDLVLLGSLQVATIYCTSMNAFFLYRAGFGICMGAVWSLAGSTIFDITPPECRGLLGGIFQASAACSGLTAAGLNMAFGAAPESWKMMFWISCGVSYFAAIIRFIIPESKQFREAEEKRKALEIVRLQTLMEMHGTVKQVKRHHRLTVFCREFSKMFRLHWQTFLYSALFVFLTSWANHSYGDNYFTFLIDGKGINNRDASIIAMITKTGCISGMVTIGWLGEYLGRRRIAAACTIMAALLLPASISPSSFWGLCLGGWFYQFFVESFGAVLASHLNELSPVAFRAVMPGVAYQLGTSLSAPSSWIVNKIAEKKHIVVDGKSVEAYGPVMQATAGICYILMILLAIFGPERRGADLEHFEPAGMKIDDETIISHDEEEGRSSVADIDDERQPMLEGQKRQHNVL